MKQLHYTLFAVCFYLLSASFNYASARVNTNQPIHTWQQYLQHEHKMLSDTIVNTDPVFQDKKKAKENAKKKAEEEKEDEGVLGTLKEMFQHAFDYIYSADEKKEEDKDN